MPERFPSPSSPTLAIRTGAIGESSRGLRGFPRGGYGEQRGEARAVIGDAGAEQFAVGRSPDVFRSARREDGIEMSGNGDLRRFAASGERSDDVAGAVDFRVPFEVAKTGGDPFGALLFKESGRGDTAELEMLFLNPERVRGGTSRGRRARQGRRKGRRRIARGRPSISLARGTTAATKCRLWVIFHVSKKRSFPAPPWWRGGLGEPAPSRRIFSTV